jgi:hypothetical protein
VRTPDIYDGFEELLEKLYTGRRSALENPLAFAPLQSSLLHELPAERRTAY